MNNFNQNFAYVRKLIYLIVVISNGGGLQTVSASEPPLLSLNMGFTSGTLYDVDLNDALAAQETWVRSILQQINQNKLEVEVKTVAYANVSAIAEAIKKNEIDAIIVLPLEYLALRDEVSIKPIITSHSADDAGDRYVIVTHQQNNIQTIEQLQSHSLMITIKGSNEVPKIWLETILLEKALPPCETFFGAINRVSKTTQAILPVFFKQADVCLVPKTDLDIAMTLNPQLKSNLQIIQQSPGYNHIIICVQNSFYEKYANLHNDVIEVANRTKQGQQLSTLFRISRLSRFEEAHLDNVKKLVQTYQRLSKTSIFPQKN
ncbi:MAG: ABC-type phosphate/phosphonate transport system substrate-binding protein [Candidatus Latescibacterota bacterium]|jgi:ABC-type phosphate/phosphonate transport system substrate-binding protein